MKKILKTVLLITALCCAALCFVSSRSLDDMRSHRMDWADKKQTAIEFEGNNYLKLPDSDYFSVDTFGQGEYFVSEKDVPLLLAEYYFWDSASISKDKDIIGVFGYYFAIESKFDFYSDIIKNARMDKFFVYLSYYDDNGYYTFETKVLDDKTSELIGKALEEKKMTEPISDEEYICDEIGKCDSTGLMKGAWYTFYCTTDTKRVYVYDEAYYELPGEYYETIKALIDGNENGYSEGEKVIAVEYPVK